MLSDLGMPPNGMSAGGYDLRTAARAAVLYQMPLDITCCWPLDMHISEEGEVVVKSRLKECTIGLCAKGGCVRGELHGAPTEKEAMSRAHTHAQVQAAQNPHNQKASSITLRCTCMLAQSAWSMHWLAAHRSRDCSPTT